MRMMKVIKMKTATTTTSSPNNFEQQEPQQFCDSFFKKKDFQRTNAHTEHALSDDSCGVLKQKNLCVIEK
jgi:hypothetical protein